MESDTFIKQTPILLIFEKWRRRLDKSPFDYLLAIIAVVPVYFFAGKLGLSLAFVHPSATAVWPPTGIAIALILLLGYRMWPAIWAGALLVNITTAGDVLTSAGIATGNTLEAVAAVWLIRKFSRGLKTFDHPWDIIKYVLLVGLLAAPISATFGMGSLFLGKLATLQEIPTILVTWWLGDFMSALIVVPFIMLWVTKLHWPRRYNLRLILQGFGLLVFLFLLAQFIFSESFLIDDENYPLGYLLYPPLIWIAFRFGYLGTVTATFGIAVLAIRHTLLGHGIFAIDNTNESLLLLQLFIGTTSIIFLILSSVLYERERAEAELRSSHADLEARVKERTTELAKANMALIEADRQREILVSVASHELKTPITAIKGFAQLLARRFQGSGDMTTVQYLASMERQVNRLIELIQDLLDVNRIRANKLEFNMEAIDLDSAILDTVEEMRAAADTHSIIIEGRSNQFVFADKLRINQALSNLISNAIKYSPNADRVVVKLTTNGTEKAVKVGVQDFGMGIPDKHKDSVFDLFYRINDPSRKTVDGFGIGLYIASEIIKAHNGRIWVESNGEGGSNFCFLLPTYDK